MITINSGEQNTIIQNLSPTKAYFLLVFTSPLTCNHVVLLLQNSSGCDTFQKFVFTQTFGFGGVWKLQIYEQDSALNVDPANATLLTTEEAKIVMPESCENSYPANQPDVCPEPTPDLYSCEQLLSDDGGLTDAQKSCVLQSLSCDFLTDETLGLTESQTLCVRYPGFDDDYARLLEFWRLNGMALPSNQEKQNTLIVELKAAGAFPNADYMRVFRYDGTDDDLVFTNWADVTKFTGYRYIPLGALVRENNSCLHTNGGVYVHDYNQATDAVYSTGNDVMHVLVPIRIDGNPISINTGVFDVGPSNLFTVRQQPGPKDFWANNAGPTLPIIFNNNDIVFYGRANNAQVFTKVNAGAETLIASPSTGAINIIRSTFGRNEATAPGFSFGAGDSSGQGYAFEWFGPRSGVDLDAMFTAISNYIAP